MLRPDLAIGDCQLDAPVEAATEIANEVHDVADRVGDLQPDPSGVNPIDADEVWFDADDLAAASTVDLGVDLAADLSCVDPLLRAPTIAAIAAAIASPGISLAHLPGWPDAGPSGQGLGPLADELIGELRPGDLLVVTGSARGVGRTSLLAQLGDGLALASSPVVFVSSAAPALWRARTLARWFGVDMRSFVDARHAQREPRLAAMLTEFTTSSWAAIDDHQRFVSREVVEDPERWPASLAALRRWQREHAERSGTDAWPILIIDPVDPINQIDPIASALGLPRLAELAASEGWIVLASCDLDDDPGHARLIDRSASIRLHASAVDEQTLALELCHRRLGPRGTGQLAWHRASGRLSGLKGAY